jgi:hypothetical protein
MWQVIAPMMHLVLPTFEGPLLSDVWRKLKTTAAAKTTPILLLLEQEQRRRPQNTMPSALEKTAVVKSGRVEQTRPIAERPVQRQ